MTSILLLGSELKVLGTLDAKMLLGLAYLALETQHNLTSSLGLFVENRLCLSSESHLLGVIPTLALRKVGRLAGLVLRHLVESMLFAFLAVRPAFFRHIHHCCG